MDKRYEAYALADGHFYETPDRLSAGERAGTTAPGYETARRAVPEGWRAARIGDWPTLTPVDGAGRPRPAPSQGWKVHASATRANAERIAATVWDYCVPRLIPFKFVPGPHLLHLRNATYAGRDTSGTFVTVYPADEGQLHLVLRALGALLEGLDGPYILTDLRWNEGPRYVRYGAFARSFVVDERGSLVPAVRDGSGTLVPDQRKPTFHVPEWVALPSFLAPQLAARNTTTVGGLPYRIEKAPHVSNGGGVHVGTDTRDGHAQVAEGRDADRVRAVQVRRADVRPQGPHASRRGAPGRVVHPRVGLPAEPLRQDRPDQTCVVHEKYPDHVRPPPPPAASSSSQRVPIPGVSDRARFAKNKPTGCAGARVRRPRARPCLRQGECPRRVGVPGPCLRPGLAVRAGPSGESLDAGGRRDRARRWSACPTSRRPVSGRRSRRHAWATPCCPWRWPR
ncbi:hypothetical protein GCM10027075_36920 [Streptomyces heilongjiangensis]